MKNMIKTLKMTTILLLTVCIASCDSDNNDGPTKNIFQHISDTPELSTFKAILEKPQFEEVKDILNTDSSSESTVFAPTNAAFEILLGGVSVDDFDINILSDYLNNHITQGKFQTETIISEELGYLKVLSGNNLFFNALGNAIILNGNANIVGQEFDATNGVMHIVDAPIEIPTLTTFINAHPELETIKEILIIIETEEGSSVNAELTENMNNAYTIFVPNDDAFNSLYEEIKAINTINDIGSMALEDIVEVHIIPNINRSASYIENQVGNMINTEGGILTVGITPSGNSTLTDSQGRTATIIRTNIRASNGYMHFIDRVLLTE